MAVLNLTRLRAAVGTLSAGYALSYPRAEAKAAEVRHSIVVVGGGAAGLSVAAMLLRKLGGAAADVADRLTSSRSALPDRSTCTNPSRSEAIASVGVGSGSGAARAAADGASAGAATDGDGGASCCSAAGGVAGGDAGASLAPESPWLRRVGRTASIAAVSKPCGGRAG